MRKENRKGMDAHTDVHNTGKKSSSINAQMRKYGRQLSLQFQLYC